MLKLFGGGGLQYVETNFVSVWRVWQVQCLLLSCHFSANRGWSSPTAEHLLMSQWLAPKYTTAVGTLSQETWQYAWVRFNSISHCSCRKTRSLSAVKVSCTAEVLQTVLTLEVQRLGFNWLEWIPASIWGRGMNISHIAPLGKREALIFNSFAWI